MIQIDKLLRQCEDLTAKCWQIEGALTTTMQGLGHISKQEDWNSFTGPKVEKFSAGVVIVEGQALDNITSVDQLRVAMQMLLVNQAFYGEKVKKPYLRVAIPGGAIQSKEEAEGIADGTVPPDQLTKAFYYVAQKQLFESGRLTMTYDFKSGIDELLSSETFRRLVLEMGEAGASKVEVLEVLPDTKFSVLPNMTLFDADKVRAIGERLQSFGVTVHEDITLRRVATKVSERTIVASAMLGSLLDDSKETKEQKEVRIFTLSELVRIGESSASEKGFTQYRQLYPNDRHDGLRNPSAAWLLGQFVRWLSRKISASDSYQDGSARQSHLSSATL